MFIFSSLWHKKKLQMGTDRSGDLLMCRFCGSSNKMEISPTTKWTGACGSGCSVGFRGRVFGQVLQKLFYCKTIGSTIPYHVYGWINHHSMAVHQSPCHASAMRSKDSGCGAASSMKNFPQTLRQQGNRYRQVPELRAFFLTSKGELSD